MMTLYLLYRLTILTVFMILLTQCKYTTKKTSIILLCVMLILWFINSVILEFTDVDFSNTLYPVTISFPVFICFFKISRASISKVLFSFLTVCNFGMFTSFAGLLAFFFTGSFIMRVLFELLGIVFILFVIKVYRKPYFKILNTLSKGWWILCTVPSLLCAIIYLLLYYPTEIKNWPENIPTTILVFILMFIFYIIVYSNFENITQYYQIKHDKDFMLIQTELQRREYAAIMDKVNAIHVFRHDLRHHITMINTFLNDNNISEAQGYLNQISNELNNTIVEQYCENYMINVILSTYIDKAKKQHIAVSCKANISETINIDNTELGSVFANAIENAILACEKIDDFSKREICIVCKKHYDQLYIQIRNPFIGEIAFDGDCPISNHKDHGFGTKSIVSITEKNGGVFSFVAENGIFKTTVILNV